MAAAEKEKIVYHSVGTLALFLSIFLSIHTHISVNWFVCQYIYPSIIHPLIIITFFFFGLFRATPMAYGSSHRLGVESEIQLLAYATATATRDPSHVCDLHHSSGQHQIPHPLSEARDRTHILMDPSRIHLCCTTTGTPNHSNCLLSVTMC